MLAIARALIRDPKIILLDEPFEGLAPTIVHFLVQACRELVAAGQTIVLVEQSPRLVFDIADDIVILNTGQVAVAGAAAEFNNTGVDLRQHLGVF